LNCVEGRTGHENKTLTHGLGGGHVAAAAAGAVGADLGHEVADLGREATGQGHEVVVQGRGPAAVTAAEIARPGPDPVGHQRVEIVCGQLGQGQGQSLRRLQGHQGEF